MCDCGTETETTEHFFLRCPFFVFERQKLLNNVYDKHFSYYDKHFSSYDKHFSSYDKHFSPYDKHFSSQNLNEKSMTDILLY